MRSEIIRLFIKYLEYKSSQITYKSTSCCCCVSLRLAVMLLLLSQRHRLVSVLARLLVLRVGHREEVLQLPLQRLERRPLHRVLSSRNGLIFYHNWKYFNLLPRRISSWFYNQQFTWSFWSLRRNYLSLEPLNVKLANY